MPDAIRQRALSKVRQILNAREPGSVKANAIAWRERVSTAIEVPLVYVVGPWRPPNGRMRIA